jgi:hypothetical protein
MPIKIEYPCEGCLRNFYLEELPPNFMENGKCYDCIDDECGAQDDRDRRENLVCVHCGNELIGTVCSICGVINEENESDIIKKQ